MGKLLNKLFLIREIKSQKGVIHFRRWRLISTPWFSIFIHEINEPDKDAHMHDHPWNFIGIILKGGYVELTENGEAHKSWISFNKAEKFHKIKSLYCKTYTMVITGSRYREWGYNTENGWLDNITYRILKNNRKI